MKLSLISAMVFGLAAAPLNASDWELNAQQSVISFGSITNDETGEAHRFTRMSGLVTPDGFVEVAIDLRSAHTGIDIRDEQLDIFVFNQHPIALIETEVDMATFAALEVGEGTAMELGAVLSLMGTQVPVYLDIHVLRVQEYLVMVTSNTATYVGLEELGVNAGIDDLQTIAELDAIARVSPVTFRLMFDGF